MLRLLADENFDQRILRGLKLRYSGLDYVVVQETEMSGAHDALLLDWAAKQNRVLLTHDFKTMLKFAYERVAAGKPMSGVIAIPTRLSIGEAIDDLVILIERSGQAALQNLVLYLPLRP